MFGLGSVAGFFIGGINLPNVFPWLGRTQLEVLSVISSVLLLALHGVTAASVEEKVLITDGQVKSSLPWTRPKIEGGGTGAHRMAMSLCEYSRTFGKTY
jgi:hypothetical protein